MDKLILLGVFNEYKSDALLQALSGIPEEQLADFVRETGLLETPRPRLGRPRSGKEKFTNMGFTAPPRLERLLVTVAKQRGGTVSALVRELILIGLEKQGIIYEEAAEAARRTEIE